MKTKQASLATRFKPNSETKFQSRVWHNAKSNA